MPSAVPVYSVERVCFHVHKLMAQFVWEISVLEGQSYSFSEVQTLLDGVTVGGHRISEQRAVLQFAADLKQLLADCKAHRFELRQWFDVRIGCREDRSGAGPTSIDLGNENLSAAGLRALQREVPAPFEKALAVFLLGIFRPSHHADNLHIAMLAMNGVLLSSGMDAISVPAVKAKELHEKLALFRQSKDGTALITLMAFFHLDRGARS
jgi:hypothetical protein